MCVPACYALRVARRTLRVVRKRERERISDAKGGDNEESNTRGRESIISHLRRQEEIEICFFFPSFSLRLSPSFLVSVADREVTVDLWIDSSFSLYDSRTGERDRGKAAKGKGDLSLTRVKEQHEEKVARGGEESRSS